MFADNPLALLGTTKNRRPIGSTPPIVPSPYDRDPEPVLGNDDPIEVMSRNPRRKAGWLGQIIDTLSLMKNGRTPFQDRKDMHDIEDAFSGADGGGGFAENPLGTLKRIMSIDPATGWKMYGQYADDQRADATYDRLMGKDQESYLKVARQMAGVATEQNWSRLQPELNKYIKAKGLGDEFLLPEQYDPDSIASFTAGGMPLAAQERARHNLVTEEQAATNEAGRNTRLEISEDGKDRRSPRGKAASGAPVQTPHGQVRYLKDGNAVHTDENGVQVGLQKVAGRWRPTTRRIPSEEEEGGYRYEININGKWVKQAAPKKGK